jgi:hypothetical protein
MTNITNLVSTYTLEKEGVSVTLEVRHHSKTFSIKPGKNGLSVSDLYHHDISPRDEELNEHLRSIRMTTALVHEAVTYAEDLLQDKLKPREMEMHASAIPSPDMVAELIGATVPMGPSCLPGGADVPVENRDSEGVVYYLTPEDKQKEIKVVLHDKPVLVTMSDVHYVVSTNEGRRTMFMTDSGRSYRCLSTYNHILAQIMSPGKNIENQHKQQ